MKFSKYLICLCVIASLNGAYIYASEASSTNNIEINEVTSTIVPTGVLNIHQIPQLGRWMWGTWTKEHNETKYGDFNK